MRTIPAAPRAQPRGGDRRMLKGPAQPRAGCCKPRHPAGGFVSIVGRPRDPEGNCQGAPNRQTPGREQTAGLAREVLAPLTSASDTRGPRPTGPLVCGSSRPTGLSRATLSAAQEAESPRQPRSVKEGTAPAPEGGSRRPDVPARPWPPSLPRPQPGLRGPTSGSHLRLLRAWAPPSPPSTRTCSEPAEQGE